MLLAQGLAGAKAQRGRGAEKFKVGKFSCGSHSAAQLVQRREDPLGGLWGSVRGIGK